MLPDQPDNETDVDALGAGKRRIARAMALVAVAISLVVLWPLQAHYRSAARADRDISSSEWARSQRNLTYCQQANPNTTPAEALDPNFCPEAFSLASASGVDGRAADKLDSRQTLIGILRWLTLAFGATTFVWFFKPRRLARPEWTKPR